MILDNLPKLTLFIMYNMSLKLVCVRINVYCIKSLLLKPTDIHVIYLYWTYQYNNNESMVIFVSVEFKKKTSLFFIFKFKCSQNSLQHLYLYTRRNRSICEIPRSTYLFSLLSLCDRVFCSCKQRLTAHITDNSNKTRALKSKSSSLR